MLYLGQLGSRDGISPMLEDMNGINGVMRTLGAKLLRVALKEIAQSLVSDEALAIEIGRRIGEYWSARGLTGGQATEVATEAAKKVIEMLKGRK